MLLFSLEEKLQTGLFSWMHLILQCFRHNGLPEMQLSVCDLTIIAAEPKELEKLNNKGYTFKNVIFSNWNNIIRVLVFVFQKLFIESIENF